MNQVHHSEKASIKSIIYLLCLVSTAFRLYSPAQAQIIPDNTLGAEASQLKQNVLINGALGDKIEGGAARGSNLFHSFSEFNIPDGQRVYFANPIGIENILTRVTGRNASNIFGTLGVAGAANLFLINPNGILFGQNARLDVQGSFVGTTANGVQFGNQGLFSATNPQAPPLLTIQPSALWFNQLNQNAAIQNNSVAAAGIDSSGVSRFGLRVPDGKSLLLVGGNVSIDGGELFANGGRVELGGLAAPGNVNLLFNGDNLSLKFPLNVTRASVSLTNKAGVYVTGAGGGNIAVNARNVEILGGSVLSAGIGQGLGKPETVAGDITLNATGEIKVAGGSIVRNLVRLGSQGNGGNITIDSGSFSLRDGAKLNASTFGQGNAGNVTVIAKNAVSLAGQATDIFSNVETGGVGNSGGINIRGSSLSLTDGAQLQSGIRGADTNQVAGKGNGGSVDINVTGAVTITGTKNDFPSAIFTDVETGARGNGGNINISSGSFFLTDGGKLIANTGGQGLDSPRSQAGNITLNTTGKVEVAGADSGIRSTLLTGGVGNGGNIFIDSGSFSLRDGAQLNASTSGVGNAGNVTVGAKNAISLANSNNFSTVEAGGVGKGGSIDINAATLSLTDGAQLLTITRGASATQPAGRGDAGNVNVKVIGAVDIAGEKNGFPSGIRSLVGTGAVGNGGNIFIDSGDFSLRDGAQLNASTSGVGNAGNIAINLTDNLNLENNSQINTATYGQGNAGNIFIDAKNSIFLANNSFINSSVGSGGVGKGGDIDVNTRTLALESGSQLGTAVFRQFGNIPGGRGKSGELRINAADSVTLSGSGLLGFSSGLITLTERGASGDAGDITVTTGNFRVVDGAVATASTFNDSKRGDITINANTFEAINGGQVITNTRGAGNAGNIRLNVKDNITIAGSDPNFAQRLTRTAEGIKSIGSTDRVTDVIDNEGAASGIFANTIAGSTGQGGSIFIDPASFIIRDGAKVSVNSAGTGNAGNITVKTGTLTLDNQASISAQTASSQGGNININAEDYLLMHHGSQISTTAGTAQAGGDGGNININSRFIIAIPEENSDISANAFTGTGGNIQINSQGIFGIESRPKLTNKSDITASSELGVSGVTNINAPDNSSIQNSFTQLSPNVIDTNALIANSCISRGTKRQENSFTITGSGALRNSPEDGLVSTYTTGEVRGVEPTSRTWKKGDPIIEPQGLYRLPNGQLILSRSCSI
ncbi:MAG: filamentous hemagglutinin N-terminal domain-containing protein [Nostoc sp. NMS7]|uniref:two-partner secretion domain-containing protein n=1 Tax=Nostoc sp. NMS7 TaxID=2815391 RepID=UPI0025E936AF|nr:filamentous hemagglutinin N-terminal domain-containing protein [Nostoc sp. NMS7]MBN3951854.1 filamentous hemagglutinin N-terminal domain-containing protein [Nostoc sp. NMS7]